MPNKISASEWLVIAFHDLKSAEILIEARHFTDSIGCDLQQSLEKILKSILAYNSLPIRKTHDLVELYALTKKHIKLTDSEIDFLEKATIYYKEVRYPHLARNLPPISEIKEVAKFVNSLFSKVCLALDLNEHNIKQ